MAPPVDQLMLVVVLFILNGSKNPGTINFIKILIQSIVSSISQKKPSLKTGDQATPVTIENNNVEESSSRVEIHTHHHYHDSNSPNQTAVSDGGRRDQ